MQASDWHSYEFPKRLARARRLQGATQQALAHQLKSRQDAVSRAENGVKPREPLRSQLVAYVLEVEALEGDPIEEMVKSIASSPELRALIRRIVAQINA